MIEHNYNKTATVKRYTDGDGNLESYADHLSNIPCMIYNLSESYDEDIDGRTGKDWIMLCGNVDIKEQDKVIIDSVEYKVVGKKPYDRHENYLELTIRKYSS